MDTSRLQIWCDGGCRGNQSDNNIGAWGAYMSFQGRERKICGYTRNTTNNKMELQAVIEALKVMKKRTTPITIYLDSAYVLNGITTWIHSWIKNGWRTSKKQPVENRELWMELYDLKNTFADIEFVKVKGHSNNEGNIKADALCNKAMDEAEYQNMN